MDRARTRARGQGHRRRISEARASRSTSIYETIEEEMTSTSSLLTSPHSVSSDKTSVTHGPSPVFVVDPQVVDLDSASTWDDDNGITELRRYYALKEEAEDTVTDSKRVWVDTPFSLYAIQCKSARHVTFSLYINNFHSSLYSAQTSCGHAGSSSTLSRELWPPSP